MVVRYQERGEEGWRPHPRFRPRGGERKGERRGSLSRELEREKGLVCYRGAISCARGGRVHV